MPVLLPLGVLAGILVLPIAGVRAIKNKIDEANQMKEYRADKTTYMAILTDDMMNSYTDR